MYSLKLEGNSPVATGTNTRGERGREGWPAGAWGGPASLWQVAHSPSLEPFYTLGLRQLWSKVDPLKQLGARA